MKKYYVYIHYYLLENGLKYIFYVGKGKNNRCYNFNQRNDIHKKYQLKYGVPNVEIVKYFDSDKEALRLEKKLKYKYYKMGMCIACKEYNTIGKNNYWHKNGVPKETRDKISNTLKGRKLPQETKDKISKKSKGSNNGMYGKGYLLKGKGTKKVAIIDENNNVIIKTNSVKEMYDICKNNYDMSSGTVKNLLRTNKEISKKFKEIYKCKIIYI